MINKRSFLLTHLLQYKINLSLCRPRLSSPLLTSCNNYKAKHVCELRTSFSFQEERRGRGDNVSDWWFGWRSVCFIHARGCLQTHTHARTLHHLTLKWELTFLWGKSSLTLSPSAKTGVHFEIKYYQWFKILLVLLSLCYFIFACFHCTCQLEAQWHIVYLKKAQAHWVS